MSWWVRDPEVAEDDELVWSVNANRESSEFRQVGGKLFASSAELIFQPNRTDERTGGKAQHWPFSQINKVDVEPRQASVPLAGRSARNRKRLRVTTSSGAVELFIVNRVDNVVAYLAGRAQAGD